MQDVAIPLEMMHDPQGKDNPANGRDPNRTPMQWDDTPNAGFSPAGIQTWLPIASDYQNNNVAAEQQDPRSFLTLTRTLLTLRRALPALSQGTYQTLDQDNANCFAFLREHEGTRYLVVLNFAETEQVVKPLPTGQGHIILSTHLDREEDVDLAHLQLRAHEGCLIRL
ncbi:hypothetical protein KSC_066610 [Ktedonobacter sp. SOSP1-52]|nr:DUF3459 domain-containing protein [Ktedonobacter sp. SOSP1-52]GHO67769.1 hypothetical protein KSC_066610 [Ktedonobacter sp. SOSP1-52]